MIIIDAIVNDIATNTTDISAALSEIEELGGSQEDIQTAQKAVEKQVEIIEENLRIVNDGVSSSEAKDNALKNIKQASATIASITSEMVFLAKEGQEALQEQNKIVENAANNIASLVEKSVSTISNGTVDLQSFIQNAGQQIVTNTKSSTVGVKNEFLGTKATTIGTSTSWIPGVNVSTAKFLQIGADQTAAGGVRISGAAKNIESLTKAIGTIGSDLSNIVGSTQNIQGVGASATDLIGQYQTKLSSIITTTGSWTQVVDANNELNQAIAEYEGQEVDYTKLFDSKNNGAEQTKQTSYQTPWAQYAKQNSQEQQNTNNNQQNKTLEFDTQKFKKAFGI